MKAPAFTGNDINSLSVPSRLVPLPTWGTILKSLLLLFSYIPVQREKHIAGKQLLGSNEPQAFRGKYWACSKCRRRFGPSTKVRGSDTLDYGNVVFTECSIHSTSVPSRNCIQGLSCLPSYLSRPCRLCLLVVDTPLENIARE